MKKIIIFTIILLVGFSSISLAADFEFDGGFLYTTFDSDNLNDGTNGINDYYQNQIDNAENDPNIDLQVNNFNKMDELDNATGYWIGFKSDYLKNELGLGYEIGVNYETFSNEVEANLHVTDQNTSEYIKIDDSLEVEVKGFAVNGERKVNDYFGITGTIGYYYGEIKFSEKEEIYDGSQTDTYENSGSNDLEGGAGFKVGLSTDFPLSENLTVIGNANYRWLELDIEDSNESIDFNGWELKAGLSYKF
jgi:hypothetical protein